MNALSVMALEMLLLATATLAFAQASTCSSPDDALCASEDGSSYLLQDRSAYLRPPGTSLMAEVQKSTTTQVPKGKSSVDVELVFPKRTGQGFQNPLVSMTQLRGFCNPALLILDDAGTALAASRRFHLDSSQHCFSDIAVGQLPLQRFLSLDRDWNLEHYTMLEDPRGVSRDVNVECSAEGKEFAFGPEDPKFFLLENKIYISIVGTEMVLDPHYDIKDFLHRPKCTETQGMQHHIAELVTSGKGLKVRPETVVKLRTENMAKEERNWNLFTWTNPQGGQRLHAVYRVCPHTILDVDVSTGKSPRLYETYSTKLDTFMRQWNLISEDVHSGAGVAYVSNENGSSYYISALHFWTDNNGRNYAHFLYTFSAEPPFNITAIAKKPLPLQASQYHDWWHNETYVSSLLVHDQLLIIGYGQADQSSRIYQQELNDALQEFF